MATSMSAVLRINAQTSGSERIKELDKTIRRLGPGAEASVVGVARLNRAMMDLGSVAGGIGLASVGASLIAFGGNAVQAGDDTLLVQRRIEGLAGQMGEAARLTDFASKSAERFTLGQLDTSKAVADLYGRLRPMGVALSDIQSTFTGVNNVARVAGLSAFDASEAFRQLGQAMGSGSLQGDEFRSIMERMPQIGTAIVDVFNDIARSKGLEQITRQRADVLVAEVKEGEKRQTSALKEQVEQRKKLAEDETNELLREIKKRYDAQRKALGDSFDDIAEEEARQREKRTEGERDAVNEQYDERRKGIERMIEDERKALSDREGLSDEERTIYERRLEDRRDALIKDLEESEEAELEKIKDVNDKAAKISQRALRDRKEREDAAMQERQDSEEKDVKDSLEKRKKEIDAHLEDQTAKNKKANEEMIVSILARVRVTQGDLKKMAAEGLITTDVLLKAMKKLEDMKIPESTAMQNYNKAMKDLSQEVGDNLLPALTPLIKALSSAVVIFGQLPEPIQAVIVGITGLGVALAGLQFTTVLLGLGGLKGALAAIGSIKIGATIGGMLGAVGPAIAVTQAALGGFLAWCTGTLLPGLAAVFSGPVGWIALAVAALVAAVIIWREPLMKFVKWLWEWGEPIREFWVDLFGVVGMLAEKAFIFVKEAAAFWFKLAWDIFYEIFISPFVEAWNMVKNPIQGFFNWFVEGWTNNFNTVVTWMDENVIKPIGKIWDENIRTPISNFFKWISDEWNKAYKAIVGWLDTNFVKPFNNVWTELKKSPEEFTKSVKGFFFGLYDDIVKKSEEIQGFLGRLFKMTINGLINNAIDKINGLIDMYNFVANAVNNNTSFKMSVLQRIPRRGDEEALEPAKKMALGAYVNKPTFAEIGEGADPREYVIPHHGMSAAAAGWQSGLRGNDLVAAWQSPAPSMQNRSSGGLVPGSSLPIQVTVTHAGEVYQLPGGRDLVRLDQVPAIVEAAVQAVRRRG